jgi:hypothetical protein
MWAPTNGVRHALRWKRQIDPIDDQSTTRSHVSPLIPDATQRWRCAGCGNLTRFDVRRTRRTTEFWHFDLAGEHRVEETEVEGETVESVTCRWCGRSDAIEVVLRAEDSADDAATG